MKAKTTIVLFIVDLFLMYFTTHAGDNGSFVQSLLGDSLFKFYVIILIGFLIFTPINIIALIYINYDNERQAKLNSYRKTLWINYQNALNSGDKKSSIICGRQYYASHNIYDEQRIQNDLLCFLNTQK